MTKTKTPVPPLLKQRQFTWPVGAADRVLNRIERWFKNYNVYVPEFSVPVNPRKVVPPNKTDDEAIAIATRFKHKIGFRLNEISWIRATLAEENPGTKPAQTFEEAYQKHLEYVKQNPSFSGEWMQWYELTLPEVQYIYIVLSRIKFGYPTPAQVREASKDAAKGDW